MNIWSLFKNGFTQRSGKKNHELPLRTSIVRIEELHQPNYFSLLVIISVRKNNQLIKTAFSIFIDLKEDKTVFRLFSTTSNFEIDQKMQKPKITSAPRHVQAYTHTRAHAYAHTHSGTHAHAYAHTYTQWTSRAHQLIKSALFIFAIFDKGYT